MDRVSSIDAVDIGGGKLGFQDEILSSGSGSQEGTTVPALWLNGVQEELMAVIELTGGEGDSADNQKIVRSIQSGKLNYTVADGTANALTATLSPAVEALVDGMRVWLRTPNTNTSAVVSLDIGPGAVSICRGDSSALAMGDIAAGGTSVFEYDATLTKWKLINPQAISRHVVEEHNTSGTSTWTAPVTGWYWVEVYGGGGAPANYTGNLQGEGGGGGGYAGKWLFFTAGDTVALTVGAEGVFGGANGGTSSFGAFLSATGGGTASSGGTPGSGGVGSGGDVNLSGQNGTDGNNNGQWAGFGGDAAGPNGGKGAVSSNGATWPGGGGGLLSYSSNIVWTGSAANGGVIITY